MKDPVVTDVGQTYERTSIEEHIKKNGKTDPFTREPISGNLYPNVALKCAIDSFI
jgi:STIP1 family protein 1